jgi:5-methylcytosine-specific restriction endonuclease McrA
MTDSETGKNKRADIFRRDTYRCVYCARIFTDSQLTLDHVQPLVKGGDNSPGNLVTACAPCNTRKGGRAAWAWLKDNPDERKNFLNHATHVWPRLRRAVESVDRSR